MKTAAEILLEAAHLVDGTDNVLANSSIDGLNSRDCYDLAESLERARNLLLVIGDRLSTPGQADEWAATAKFKLKSEAATF
jgi:hypothetical protein